MLQKIPDNLTSRVTRLEQAVVKMSQEGNLVSAKESLNDLRPILEKYGQNSRLLQSYLRLYEGALESHQLETARDGFADVRRRSNRKTRLYLEATSLLAITFIRLHDLNSAEPLMHEVFNNDIFIRSERQRQLFIQEISERFDREGAISALARVKSDELSEREVHEQAMALLQQGLTDSELTERLGAGIPDSVRNYVLRINQIARKSLPASDLKLLPPPRDFDADIRVGGLIFRSLQRRLHKFLCDEESEVYQAWLREGLNGLCSKAWVSAAVLSSLGSLRIAAGGMAVSLVAIVVQSGLTNFCRIELDEHFLSLRKKL